MLPGAFIPKDSFKSPSLTMRLILLLLTLALPLRAQETLIRQMYDTGTDTHVEVLALFSKPSPGGYFPVRVKIANNIKRESTIRLNFKSSSSYSGGVRTASSYSITAPPDKVLTRDLLVPINPPNSSTTFMISASLRGSLGEGSHDIRLHSERGQPAVLLSEALFTPNASTLDSEIQKKFSRAYGGSVQFAAKFDPKQLPDDWRAFSGYDSVVMSDADWSNIPPGARNAILSWVRLGGQLVIDSESSASPGSLGLPADSSYGSIRVSPLSLAGKLDAKKLVDLVTGNPIKAQHSSTTDDFQSRWPLQNLFGTQTFRYSLFVAVLIVFGILVGPINLFVFARSGQRHKLFITTPLISLGASLLLIALIITQDGFGGNGIRRVLMEVRPDGGVNAAHIHQEQFSRTGVLTRAGFTIDRPAVFKPVSIGTSRWARFTNSSGGKGNFNLQPGDGKLAASGDWFQSRSEHGHILSAVVSTRGRIESTDDANAFLSTFEFPIQTLYYLDEASQWHRADKIQPGKRFTLTPIDTTMAEPELLEQANAFGQRNRLFLTAAKDRPGHFVAITDQAPGIETHPGIKWKKTETVITGPISKS
jgi:hypothetical protein